MVNKKWLEAAVRYDSIRKPTLTPMPTLRGFMESEEGESALKLLATADESVVLANYDSNCHLVLGGKGLKIHDGDHVRPISTKDAAKILEKIRKIEPDYEPIAQIRRQLDQIADNAP